MDVVQGGVTAAKGFFAASTAAGIKYEDRKDMALIVSEMPAASAGVFTTSIVKAAPVLWDQKLIEEQEHAGAIVANAGIANACTGAEGMEVCLASAGKIQDELGISAEQVLIASTGVIGMQIPMEKIYKGLEDMVPELGHDLASGTEAAKAILTTDTMEKEVAVTFEIGLKKVTIGGMCKGSGMIAPNMCTMLSFLTTDLAISKELLQEALRLDVEDTYNMVSVDGDTSTNDTVLLLANGMAGNKLITEKDENYRLFAEALHYVNKELAKKLAADGEGATTLLEAKVVHADSKENARLLAKSIINSPLVKTAVFGRDANWGRILMAMGHSGARFDPDQMDVFFENEGGMILIYQDGLAAKHEEKDVEEEAKKILSQEKVSIVVDLKNGTEGATAWGCDLTYDYIKINADYRS